MSSPQVTLKLPLRDNCPSWLPIKCSYATTNDS